MSDPMYVQLTCGACGYKGTYVGMIDQILEEFDRFHVSSHIRGPFDTVPEVSVEDCWPSKSEESSKPTASIKTGVCVICGKDGSLELPEETVVKWVTWNAYGRKTLIQDEFPELSADQREQLIIGTHGECFDKIFEDDDE